MGWTRGHDCIEVKYRVLVGETPTWKTEGVRVRF
jgi:hypothetical protein